MILSRDLLNIILIYDSNEYENKKKLNDEYSRSYFLGPVIFPYGEYECLHLFENGIISKMFNYRMLSGKWKWMNIPKRYIYSNK